MLTRGAALLVACGACALALGAVLLSADTGRSPASAAPSGSAAAPAVAYGHLLLLGPAKAGYFDTPSQMPGALIEPLFVTDPFEASIAASVHGHKVIAKALAEAIEQYVTGW
jgi:hypothetical protein